VGILEKKVNFEKKTTRQALLEAAEVLFSQSEYSAVSTRNIAEAASVNLGSIKYHFGSKAQLFIEVVREVMARREDDNPMMILDEVSLSAEDAAEQLAKFIVALMTHIFHKKGSNVRRIVLREILSSTSFNPEIREAIVDSTVNDFMKPIRLGLLKIMQIIAPEMPEVTKIAAVHLVAAQTSYFFTHRAFVERLDNCDYSKPELCNVAAKQITDFTLRVLNCENDFIEQVLLQVFDKNTLN
jgi:AcrR family transcriptional regulator